MSPEVDSLNTRIGGQNPRAQRLVNGKHGRQANMCRGKEPNEQDIPRLERHICAQGRGGSSPGYERGY